MLCDYWKIMCVCILHEDNAFAWNNDGAQQQQMCRNCVFSRSFVVVCLLSLLKHIQKRGRLLYSWYAYGSIFPVVVATIIIIIMNFENLLKSMNIRIYMRSHQATQNDDTIQYTIEIRTALMAFTERFFSWCGLFPFFFFIVVVVGGGGGDIGWYFCHLLLSAITKRFRWFHITISFNICNYITMETVAFILKHQITFSIHIHRVSFSLNIFFCQPLVSMAFSMDFLLFIISSFCQSFNSCFLSSMKLSWLHESQPLNNLVFVCSPEKENKYFLNSAPMDITRRNSEMYVETASKAQFLDCLSEIGQKIRSRLLNQIR